MNVRSLLVCRIDALLQDLDWAERAVNASHIPAGLREAIVKRFATLTHQKRTSLKALRDMAQKGQDLDLCWTRLRQETVDILPLLQEHLAFLGGALIRSVSLDNGLCQVADVLLKDLSNRIDVNWPRFTLLAEGEFFTETTEIIRLRFPDFSIWSLPVVAHEFGHYLGPRLPDGRGGLPFRDLLEQEVQPQQKSFLHEHFADLFAVYTLGPAFACACILLRFSPSDDMAATDGRQHPSHSRRIYLILKALEELNRPYGVFSPFQGLISSLRGQWEEALESAGKTFSLDAAKAPLDALFDRLYWMLRQYLPLAQYNGLPEALQISSALQTGERISSVGRKIPDLLNAAWLRRIQEWEDPHQIQQIGQIAMTMCREVAEAV